MRRVQVNALWKVMDFLPLLVYSGFSRRESRQGKLDIDEQLIIIG